MPAPPPPRATARPAPTGARSGLISQRRPSTSSTLIEPASGFGSSPSGRPCRPPPSGRRGTWRCTATWPTTIPRRPSRAAPASGWPPAASRAAGARTSPPATRRLRPSSTAGSTRPATAPTSRTRATSRWAPALPRVPRASSTGRTRSAARGAARPHHRLTAADDPAADDPAADHSVPAEAAALDTEPAPGQPSPAPASPSTRTAAAANVITFRGLTLTPRRPAAGHVLGGKVIVLNRGARLKTGHVFCSARFEGTEAESGDASSPRRRCGLRVARSDGRPRPHRQCRDRRPAGPPAGLRAFRAGIS